MKKKIIIQKNNSTQIKKKNIRIKFYKINTILKDQLKLKYKLIG